MSVPFFGDFIKTTKDYYKKDKYNLGQQIEVASNCGPNFKLKTKIKNGDNVKTKFVATLKRDNREIEVTEDLSKGLSLKIKIPSFYRSIDFESEHTNGDVKVTAKYKPKGSYYNTKLVGYYNPDSDGSRVCKTVAEFAVGDDQLNLCVGGKIVIQDKAKNNQPINTGMDLKIKTYSLGFLYRPVPKTEYSVIYTPDEDSNGMEYEFTCFKQMSDSCSLTAKAQGKVDTKLTGFPPVVTIGGGWSMGVNYLQGFVNSRKEWGLAYKVKVSDTTNLHLGIASYLNDGQRVNSKFGYKLCV